MDVKRVVGVVGQIKWRAYNAAAINGYTVWLSPEKKHWMLRGQVVDSDKFKLSLKPLMFVGPTKNRKTGDVEALCMPILDYEIKDGSVQASLGPPILVPSELQRVFRAARDIRALTSVK